MDDGQALLRAVLEFPEEDTPRLIYADWLQEHGEPERADRIRWMCRPDYRDDSWPLTRKESPHEPYATLLFPVDRDRHGHGVRCRWPEWTFRGFRGEVQRGFVSELTCTTADFLAHAKAIFSAHPVTSVKLQDKSSWESGSLFSGVQSWWARRDDAQIQERYHLPWALFDGMTGGDSYGPGERTRERHPPETWRYNRVFADTAAADAALSRRCVAYGRELAGLSPLKEPAPC